MRTFELNIEGRCRAFVWERWLGWLCAAPAFNTFVQTMMELQCASNQPAQQMTYIQRRNETSDAWFSNIAACFG